jgi:hypothetical protein
MDVLGNFGSSIDQKIVYAPAGVRRPGAAPVVPGRHCVCRNGLAQCRRSRRSRSPSAGGSGQRRVVRSTGHSYLLRGSHQLTTILQNAATQCSVCNVNSFGAENFKWLPENRLSCARIAPPHFGYGVHKLWKVDTKISFLGHVQATLYLAFAERCRI